MINATLTYIILIEDDNGRTLQFRKAERIEIHNEHPHGKRIDVDIRHIGSGRGDTIVDLREIVKEEKENAKV